MESNDRPRGDLGISALNDDQLLNLLTEACAVVAERDPTVRKLAQKTVTTEAERLKLMREAVESAVILVRRELESTIKQQAEEELREAVARGEVRITGIDEEIKWAVESEKEARQKVVAEAAAALKNNDEVTLRVKGQSIWIRVENKDSRMESKGYAGVSKQAVAGLISAMQRAIEG